MKKLNKLIILILFLGLTANPIFALGQTSTRLLSGEVENLNTEIDAQKTKIKKIQQQQEEYSNLIKQKQEEEITLKNQMSILDNKIARAELDVEVVELEINRVELEIEKTDTEIFNKNNEIEKEKEHIANILNLMQKKDNVTSLEILLLNDSLSEFLSQVKYLEDINDGVRDSLDVLDRLRRQLEKSKSDLDEQNQSLVKLKGDLDEKRDKLVTEKEDKEYILTQVNKSETKFQRLLAQAKDEQEAAASEIANMEKVMREKLAQLDGQKLVHNDDGLMWPVKKNIVTTYFHDPEYPFRYIFEHPAIDVRAAQGSTLRAAASGYVAKVVTGGRYGYGYIMLIHADGLATVYGHVSKIDVSQDDYVIQGQQIGLSGGLPGTPGAGRLTTGPHLHFEVRLDGIPVDPLNYLP